MKESKSWAVPIGGAFTGVLNGLFGSGGGMIAVPFLRLSGLDEKTSHATSVGILSVLSAISAGIYLWRGSVSVPDAFPYLPGALMGSAVGAWLMPRIPVKWLKRLFACLMIYGGFRMVTGS